MKMNRILMFFALAVVSFVSTSCDDWMGIEPLDQQVKNPQEQDPELWAEYTAKLRSYKQSEHFIAFARFDNAPAVATSEKDFLRCLPDSLDFVTLTNAANLSQYDVEDLAIMREMGTKVLYQVDYASRMDEFDNLQALGTYLDKVVSSVSKNGLDGYSFTGIPYSGDAARAEVAALLVEKLGADRDKTLVFEGDPTFIAQDDRSKIDYFVLNTSETTNVTDLKLQVLRALNFVAVPAEKLLLAADTTMALMDESRTEINAVTEIANRVISFGPLGGIAVYNLQSDYYDTDMNYPLLSKAIQIMNPLR